MTTRARHKTILSWFPRGLLILTAVLAPVIDHHEASGPRQSATQVEAVDGADSAVPVKVVLKAVVVRGPVG